MVTNIVTDEQSGRFRITFNLGRFEAEGRQVVVAGTFNGWSTRYDPVTTGVVFAPRHFREMTIELPPGYYEYKYYDAASGEWMEVDEQVQLYRGPEDVFVYNVYGTRNCILDLATRKKESVRAC